jgi:hypothetical protein
MLRLVTGSLPLALVIGCLAPQAPLREPAAQRLVCGFDVRSASGPYGLMFGDTARISWGCREIPVAVIPTLPEMPALSREGLPDGTAILVEASRP